MTLAAKLSRGRDKQSVKALSPWGPSAPHHKGLPVGALGKGSLPPGCRSGTTARGAQTSTAITQWLALALANDTLIESGQ